MRHFWGTTPARRLSGTTTPHATTSTSSVRQYTSMAGAAPVTGRHTRYGALHPLRGATPITRRCTRYGPLHPNRRGVMPTDRVQRPQSQEQTRNLRDAGQAAVPVGGGGAWPGNAQTTSPTDWRPPRGLRGLAGLRADAPSEARGADGERASRPRGGRRSVEATSNAKPPGSIGTGRHTRQATAVRNRSSADAPGGAVAAVCDGDAGGGQAVA